LFESGTFTIESEPDHAPSGGVEARQLGFHFGYNIIESLLPSCMLGSTNGAEFR
jgi:hypothetical protein